MFQEACKSMMNSIIPIIIASRTNQGVVNCSIGAGVMINKDGWFVTAGHILKEASRLSESVNKYDSKKGKRNHMRVTDFAAIFGDPQFSGVSTVTINEELDLGIGKLENYEVPSNSTYPVFRIDEIEQGELLCRMGYPFVDGILTPTWIKGKGFIFTNLYPVPMFINEALVSRFVNLNSGVWIETSSPGLLGQSGGPLVDEKGKVCGIQVNTFHYPLNFKGQKQFLNVGRAVHVKSIIDFLDANDIAYLGERR